ncbi:MAG: metal-dependent hydrolase, partial [Myxococcota bacterium]
SDLSSPPLGDATQASSSSGLSGTGSRPIRSRKVRLPFGPDIPKHWLFGNPIATHIPNGINLLFPAGERFFVRSVKRYLDRFADEPEALEQIRGFFGQEGNHAHEHERYFAILEEQGYQVRDFTRRFERFLTGWISRVLPPVLQLSTTAAAEHYTAILADAALRNGVLDQVHPTMRDLLLWHAAEEIEHKAVAFDVLQRVDDRYLVRVAGLVLSGLVIAGWWAAATRMLLNQDGLTRAERRIQRKRIKKFRKAAKTDARSGIGVSPGEIFRNIFWPGIRSYLRRDFHPNDHDNYHLAAEYLARVALGRADTAPTGVDVPADPAV